METYDGSSQAERFRVTHTGAKVSGDLDVSGKVLFANMYATEGDLPNATTYHGMFAHVHATGAGYFAHGGAWIRLANHSDLGGGSQNLFSTVASSGQNNIVADGTTDTLYIEAGSGISIATDQNTDTLTITATGGGGLANVVDDTTPQLGGALDLNNNNITGNGSINISGGATVSGNITAGTGTVGGLTFAGTQIASDDSTQISFQDNIEIANGPILSSTTLSHTGTFGISANTLNINAGSFGQVNIGTNQGTAPVVLGSSNNDTEVLCSGDLFIHSGIMHRHTSKTGATGTVDHDMDDGHVFMHSSMAADFTANLTNSHIGINTQTTVTFLLTLCCQDYFLVQERL